MTEPLICEDDVYVNGALQKHAWRLQDPKPKQNDAIGSVLKHKRLPWPLHQDDMSKLMYVDNPIEVAKTGAVPKHERPEWPLREVDGTLGLRTLTMNEHPRIEDMPPGGQSLKAKALFSDMAALHYKVEEHVSSILGEEKINPKIEAIICDLGYKFESNNPMSKITKTGRLTTISPKPGSRGIGLSEQVRWVLVATGVECEHVREPKTMHELPMLEIDGLKLVHTKPIVQYVAKRGGINGQNPQEEALISTVCDAITDARGPVVHSIFLPKQGEANLQASLEAHLAKHFPQLEDMLQERPFHVQPGFVPSGISTADLLLAEMIEGMLNVDARIVDSLLQQFYPRMRMLHKHVVELPSINAYLGSTYFKRHQRH